VPAAPPQVPALKQQYDRVLAELQKERDGFLAEKTAIMQVGCGIGESGVERGGGLGRAWWSVGGGLGCTRARLLP